MLPLLMICIVLPSLQACPTRFVATLHRNQTQQSGINVPYYAIINVKEEMCWA